jgi:drug/metabolite transporter (DMT)-like permease
MPLFVISFLVVIVSNLIYHFSQKSVPRDAHPIVSLLVTYGVAIVITLLLVPLFPFKEPIGRELRKINWASAVIGATIVGVELGFLLAYRAGWRISVGSAAANAAVAVLLVPAGLLFFGEKLSEANIAGLVLCVAGLLLVVMR